MVREQAVTAGLPPKRQHSGLFLPEKYPSPITTDRIRLAGGMSGSGIVFQLEGTATYATQLGSVLCGKSAEDR
jgi:hypothetical protein